MTIDVSVYGLLTGVAGITALVSTHVYPSKMPQNGTYPALTFAQIGDEEIERTLNQAPGGARLLSGRWQIDGWATTEKSARALGLAVFTGIDAYNTTTLTAGAIVRVEAIGGGEVDYDHGVEKWFSSRDYRIWWRE